MANVLAALQSSPLVASVERDPVAVPATTVPNDPYYPWNGSNVLVGGEWPHGAMHDACCSGVTQDDSQPTVWEQTVGSSSVVLADVDSGVDFAHPDLSGKQVAGVSEVGGDTVDTSGHGEYIAGTMAADTNNGIGVAGVCWACMIMPVKITTGSFATYDAMASGITWAADHGARVINVSYAGTSQSSTLDSAVQYATSHGAIVVAAAGNSGCNCPTYPAASPGAIGVAATDQFGNFMTYSNHGTWVPLAAPTGQITTWLKDPSTGQPYGYGPVGGTSISAPMVAGLLGLMISADPTATVSALKNALFSTANPTTGLDQGGSPKSVQYGVVDASKAVSAIMGVSPSPSPSPSASASPPPSPSSSPSPSPSPSPSASQSPSPSPSPSPTATTTTFSGALNKKTTFRSFSITLASGVSDGRLSFSKCPSLALSLDAASGSTVAATSGPSVVVLDQSVGSGAYTYVVSGDGTGQCSFTLTVTDPL